MMECNPTGWAIAFVLIIAVVTAVHNARRRLCPGQTSEAIAKRRDRHDATYHERVDARWDRVRQWKLARIEQRARTKANPAKAKAATVRLITLDGRKVA